MNGPVSKAAVVVALCSSLGILCASGHVANPDGHVRLAQARAWTHGQLELPENVGNPDHGNIAITPEGHRFAVSAPGQVLLFAPISLIAERFESLSPFHHHYLAAFLASFTGPILHFLSACLLFDIALVLGRERREAGAVAVLYAFATVALPHSTDGYETVQESLGILAAIDLVLRARRSEYRRVELTSAAGLAFGLALLTRSSAVLALPGLLLLLESPGRAVPFVAGALPSAAGVALYNHLRFGSVFETGYALAWNVADPGPPPAGAFSTPLTTGLYGLWLSPGKGLLLYSPVLVLALAGWPDFIRRNARPALALGLIIAAYSLFYAMNWAWHGSAWCWGPRYVIPVVSLAMLGMPGLHRLVELRRVGAAGLVALSLAVQLAGLAVDYRRPLLERYREDPSAFSDGRIFFDPALSPLLAQVKAVVELWRQSPRDLHAYTADGPWRDVARPASAGLMLQRSIDFNSWDFWWARMVHLPLNGRARQAGYALLGAAAVTMLMAAAGIARCVASHGRR